MHGSVMRGFGRCRLQSGGKEHAVAQSHTDYARFVMAPRKNSTSVGFFAYIADYQRITYAPSVVNFQTMSAQM